MVFSLQKVLQKPRSFNIFAVYRNLLTESYSSYPLTKNCETDHEESKVTLYRFMDFDHCIERGYQTTSLMLNRLVNESTTKEHVQALPYYLYNFRHSPNGYYLRPWTVHNFVKKSLELEPDVIAETLKHDAPYGIFPDDFSLNLVVDSFLKSGNLEEAMSSTSKLFLLEYFDNQVSQTLALDVLVKKYWGNKSNCKSLTDFENLESERNVAGILYTIGVTRSDQNLMLMGLSLLGKIESENGIRAVHQEPWAPLPWEEGYLQRAINLLISSSTPLSQECVDVLMKCCEKSENLLAEAESAVASAKEKNLISDQDKFTLQGISQSLIKKLPEFEKNHIKILDEISHQWGNESKLLLAAEQEIRNELEQDRVNYYNDKKLEEEAHQMAVIELGFYDLEKKDTDIEPDDLDDHLRKNYVNGSLAELDIVERMRTKINAEKNPVIITSL